MMSYRGLLAYVATLVVVAQALVGCTTEVDYTLGSEFVPTDQKMEMHRRVYEGGKVYIDNLEEELKMSTTRLYHTDSIKSSNLDYVYFGREHDDIYGTRRAGFMSQVLFGSKLDDEYGWGYRPIFDSMQMALYVNDFHGDTITKQRFNIYEIVSNDYIDGHKDSIFYINFDPTKYISKEPIFTFDFPDQERGVYVGDMENPTAQYVTLQHTEATNEYISRLMFTTQEDLNKNDNYGKDIDKIYKQGNEEEFVRRIKGIYVEPAEGGTGDGAMFATDVENSALVLYARSRYKEDPTIIKDTTIMSYNFFINPNTYTVKAGNVSLSTVEHELTDAMKESIESGRDITIGYVDGMGGVVTELRFTDEFIQSLADIALSKPNAVVSVNQARMSIYLEGSTYDYNDIDPLKMADVMNNAMPRLGLYTRYGGIDAKGNNIIAISDYAFSKEGSLALDYDGNINRSLGCYTMDISTHIQSLMMAAADNLMEDGKSVDFEKFNTNVNLLGYRRIYIAPAADQLFGFNRQAICGGEDQVIDATDASITLDLTYTIVY
jgi:hypothetical protein